MFGILSLQVLIRNLNIIKGTLIPLWADLSYMYLRRSSKKQAKIDKRKATRQEHVMIWLNAVERKSKCLYAVNITEPSVKGVYI